MQSHIGLFITIGSIFVIGVIVFFSGMQKRRQEQRYNAEPKVGEINDIYSGSLRSGNDTFAGDEILRVTRIDTQQTNTSSHDESTSASSQLFNSDIIVINVMAKPKHNFVGYELLQALLAAGMRFGEMNIFHRYQEQNGKGPILFSLAQATEPGTFDIENMGAVSCKGLSLFLRCSGNCTIDLERFNLLIKTASQLRDDLDAVLVTQENSLLTEMTIHRIRNNLSQTSIESA